MTQDGKEHGPASNGQGDEHATVKVKVEHLVSLAEVQVDAKWTDTVEAVWTRALADPEMAEPRRDTDRLQTDDGKDLMPHLARTLRELRDGQGIKSHKWQIAGPTGGAR